jgi:hypothetical protein
MGNRYDDFMRVKHLAPEANAALLALEREHGYPRELVAAVGRRFWRILRRHARLHKTPLERIEVERLLQLLSCKVCRELIFAATTLGPGIDAPEAGRILGIPGCRRPAA